MRPYAAAAVAETEPESESESESAPATEPEAATESGPREVRRAGRPDHSLEARGLGSADPVQELPLLEQAQRAVRDDPARALSLADQHRRRFPRGQFVQEREMIAVEALLELGNERRARRRGQRFLRRFPDSTHVPRLKQLLASP